MITALAPSAELHAGQTFANGTDRLHSVTFDWAATLRIVSRDPMSYGQPRYVVADRYGRRGFAFASVAY